MIKDLKNKAFKNYTYIEYYDTALDFAKDLEPEKTISMTFNREPRILKEHLV